MTARDPTPQGPSPPEPYVKPVPRSRLDAEYDAIVHQIYRAAAGTQPWTVPLVQIAEASDARSVALGAIDKRTGAVIFSYSGGPAPVEATTEYIRTYCRIDPRLALLASVPVGTWLACQGYFDDAYVGRDPFYQKFLLRHGARFAYDAKLLEDGATMVLLVHHRPPGNLVSDARVEIGVIFDPVHDDVYAARRVAAGRRGRRPCPSVSGRRRVDCRQRDHRRHARALSRARRSVQRRDVARARAWGVPLHRRRRRPPLFCKSMYTYQNIVASGWRHGFRTPIHC